MKSNCDLITITSEKITIRSDCTQLFRLHQHIFHTICLLLNNYLTDGHKPTASKQQTVTKDSRSTRKFCTPGHTLQLTGPFMLFEPPAHEYTQTGFSGVSGAVCMFHRTMCIACNINRRCSAQRGVPVIAPNWPSQSLLNSSNNN